MLVASPMSDIPRCTSTIQPDSNGYVPPGTCGYHGKMYYPSFVIAVLFTVIAAAILTGHLFQAFRFPKNGLQKFLSFISTSVFVGYVARTVGTRHQQNVPIAALSDTLILVCPTLITAFNGMVLANLVQSHDPHMQIAVLESSVVSKIVIFGTSILLSVQLGACAAIISGNPSRVQVAGIWTYIGTLGFQVTLVLFLLGCILHFYTTMRPLGKLHLSTKSDGSLVLFSFALCLSLGGVFVRIVYRLIELPQVFQPNTTLPHKEIFFYCFEGGPIFIALAVWNIVPVGSISQIRSSKKKFKYQEVCDEVDEEEMSHGESRIGNLK